MSEEVSWIREAQRQHDRRVGEERRRQWPLTSQELAVIDLLRRASEAFFDLPEHHPTDVQEWAHEVHALQQRVMARAAVRAYPGRFTPLVKRDEH